jgi:preprotein translocase subunit SecA
VLICEVTGKKTLLEFKRESFEMFTVLLETINVEIVMALCSIDVEKELHQTQEVINDMAKKENPAPVQKKASVVRKKPSMAQPVKNLKVGRNDPCPCGSGKKYKQCHG